MPVGQRAGVSPYDQVVLAWQLDAGYAYDPLLVTEVDVRFVAEGPTTTRVELEHPGVRGVRRRRRPGARRDGQPQRLVRAAVPVRGGTSVGGVTSLADLLRDAERAVAFTGAGIPLWRIGQVVQGAGIDVSP